MRSSRKASPEITQNKLLSKSKKKKKKPWIFPLLMQKKEMLLIFIKPRLTFPQIKSIS